MTEAGTPGPARSGVYRTPADFAPVREALDDARARWIEVDLDAVRTKAALLDTLGWIEHLRKDDTKALQRLSAELKRRVLG